MIDDGELDWKVIAISEDDPKAASVNDIEDVERWVPAHPIRRTTAQFEGLGSGALGNEDPCSEVCNSLPECLRMAEPHSRFSACRLQPV